MQYLDAIVALTSHPTPRFLRALCSLTCLSFAVCGSLSAQSSPESASTVVSDYAPLRTTILLQVGENIFKSSEMASGRHPFFMSGLPRGTLREHQAFIDILRREGVRILDVADLLNEALAAARDKGVLDEWVRSTFPENEEQILKHLDEVDADSVLNRRNDHFYVRDEKGFSGPLFPGISSMYWSRDFAISSPKGIIIGHGQHYNRSIENSIARLIFHHAKSLSEFPIAFDAEKEGVYLDGGDTIVLDEKTLLLGIGNRSSREAAPALARKLEMDVLAVSMPPTEPSNGLRRQLLHLDSIMNLVDEKTVLSVPYFLEERWQKDNPLKRVLSGIKGQVESTNAIRGEGFLGDPAEIQNTIDLMSEVGWVTRYKAGTGEAEKLDLKIVDYFREHGYRIVYVGGSEGDLSSESYAVERAMYELRWQGANVVQLGPGRVVAYEHNVHTNRALRDAGIEVLTFPGELLSIRNGGPHCLLMPLVRKPSGKAPAGR